jgi:cyclohexa-1,5-dienecarbonyl-CoA hydratase
MNAPVRTIEERGGAWLRVVLDRPPGNLLSREMVRSLADALEAAGPRRKWITFEGAGGEFSFGAMVQEHLPGPMEQVLQETHALLRRVLALDAPSAALVRGRCLGGGFELALACDMILAGERASLGLPEIALAAFPPGAAALLPVRAGASVAASAILTGAARSAEAWRRAGLVEAVAPDAALIDMAGQWFDAHLATRSAIALSAAARASRLALRAVAEPALAAAEKLYLDRVLTTRDAAEGVQAFVEKRPPEWSDA